MPDIQAPAPEEVEFIVVVNVAPGYVLVLVERVWRIIALVAAIVHAQAVQRVGCHRITNGSARALRCAA